MTAETEYGRRLLLSVVEQQAASGYEKAYADLPITDNPADGLRSVSYQDLVRAINRACWLLDEQLGKSKDFDTFGWMAGANDFRYIIFIYAAMKSSRKAFFPSPRNSVEAHLSLLEECHCGTFLVPKTSCPEIVQVLESKRPMRVIEIPDLDYFLKVDEDHATQPYPFQKSFDEARHQPCLIMHTSGSTGIPKCIILRHGWFAVIDAYRRLPEFGASSSDLSILQDQRALIPLPNFHVMAIIIKVVYAGYYEMTMVEFPSGPVTPELIDYYHCHANIHSTFLVPSLARELVEVPSFWEHLRNIQNLFYGGSAMSEELGRKISKNVRVRSAFGMTETNAYPSEQFTPIDDWGYYKFSLSSWLQFHHVRDDLYELVMMKDDKLDLLQAVFLTFPGPNEWHTKDLWSPHPTVPHLWRYRGRADDVIVFSNGEKFVPISMEAEIETLPEVSGALVAGSGQFQACLLIEPRDAVKSKEDKAKLLERIWASIDSANRKSVAHGKIARDFVMFTSPDKPFHRAAKGSAQRKSTLQDYQVEIKALYASQKPLSASGHSDLDFSTLQRALSSIKILIAQYVGDEDIGIETELFHSGFDSLGVVNITRNINNALGRQALSTRDIYSHPTIKQIASLLLAPNGESVQTGTAFMSREERMEEIYQTYAAEVPISSRSTKPLASNEGLSVMLTGSTGSLGSYILSVLQQDPRVAYVACLNRSSDGYSRQRRVHSQRGLCTDFAKVDFLHCDLSKPYLGLSHDTYARLLDRTTHILHNAWPVDFNLALESFIATHVHGVRRLVDFCVNSAHGAVFFLLSSMATVQRWQPLSVQQADEKVPEAVQQSWNISSPTGYAESKHISEKLINEAHRISRVTAAVARLGQIAGPVLPSHAGGGSWPKQEWLPSLIISSKHMRKLPSSLGSMKDVVNWVPVDLMAASVVESSLAMNCGNCGDAENVPVRQYVNPHLGSWSSLVPAIQDRLARPSPKDPLVEVMPYNTWLAALQASAKEILESHEEDKAKEKEKLAENPAVKLLAFFESMSLEETEGCEGKQQATNSAVLDTKLTAAASKVLRDMHEVDNKWMMTWMSQWGL